MRKGQKMPEEVKRRISATEKGKHVSAETREKMRANMTGQVGEKCRNWVGDKVGYCGIHDWLAKEFGKAKICENKNCKKISNKFEWAKIKDLPYERKRENFMQLCKSCHTIYDMAEETKTKISNTLKKYFSTK